MGIILTYLDHLRILSSRHSCILALLSESNDDILGLAQDSH